MKDSVSHALTDFASRTSARFHMPGHKGRGCGSLPFDAALPFDVTELDTTDNLYDPSENGVFHAELDFMRSVYGSAATVLTAGGATAALCAAFACCARRAPGLPVLCDRKAHISVINALALLGMEPIWFDAGSGDICELSHIYEGAHISAVFCTSPDYYGHARDIPALADLARKLGAPLIVDNSHGAHLFFHNGGALHPLKQGAALVVDSLHKTLPALTGAALLHAAAGSGFTEVQLRSALRMFVSTSPSYLISSSACACVREMAEHGETEHAKLYELVSGTRAALEKSGYTLESPDGDPFRICVSDANARGLYDILANGGVVCEFCDGRTVVLLTSVRNSAADFELLVTLCGRFTPAPPERQEPYVFSLPGRASSIRDAMLAMQEYVSLDDARGRIAAAPAAPYPPGIPVIVPGEVFDDFVIETLRKYNPDMTVAVTAL